MNKMLSVIITTVIIATFFAQGNGNQLKSLQQNHKAQDLSNADIRYLASLSNARYTNEILDNILIPRVVGTPNHEKVSNYIKRELQKLDWNVEVDEFDQNTPKFGILRFKNIIATLNPNADRYLVLACHYDSKYFEKDIFVDLSLKLIFFDGEEAFVNWGPNDSIYGAKHLAHRYHNSKQVKSNGETVSELDKIDILVLLDLIGHKKTRFYSNFEDTQHWYLRLANAEARLHDLQLLRKGKNKEYFVKRAYRGYIEDDHIPFLEKNVVYLLIVVTYVPILHLISNPFPGEWHTPADNRDIVNEHTVEDINKILRVFVAEYLNVLVKIH
ncbi:hypothetical protein NQ314_005451 [Rhamnusium bicolor]|uniref:glutaminyl-peptide cyclotransferase n=1 Tax=Rhamnusium bicolor TaxID=1586634 RepID=A0AAV8ZGS0_9CUCU|nr:hypothetical protein NQ314_005451 [Rhamnusium bicolor]